MEVTEEITVIDTQDTGIDWGPSQPLPPNKPGPVTEDSVNQDDLVEYNRLLSLIKDLPCDMFVDRLLLDYSQCDIKLEKTRQLLYDMLREADDFPFDKESDLKRRLNSRLGDSVATKLAYDVHSLLSVAEGADYGTIKDLISVSSKRSSRPSSVSRLSQRNSVQPSERCACRAEVEQLKDTLSSVQADLLLLKQRYIASENIHNSDTATLKSDIVDIKDKQSSLQTDLTGCVQDLTTCVEKLDSSIKTKIKEYDDEHKTYSVDIKALKQSVKSLNETTLKFQTIVAAHNNVSDVTSDVTSQPADAGSSHTAVSDPSLRVFDPLADADSSHATVSDPSLRVFDPLAADVLQPASGAENIAQSQSDTSDTTGINVTPPLYATVLCAPAPIRDQSQEGASLFGNMPIPTIVGGRTKNPDHGQKNSRTESSRELNFGVIRREIEQAEKAREDDDADFETYVKRKTKSFYVGNVKASITEAKIANYVYRRNVNVTNVKMYKNRKYGNVVVRVNVEDDENASRLTDDYTFWPSGVICRPWIPYHLRVKKRPQSRQDQYADYGSDGNYRSSRNDPPQGRYWNANIYGALDSDVEVD